MCVLTRQKLPAINSVCQVNIRNDQRSFDVFALIKFCQCHILKFPTKCFDSDDSIENENGTEHVIFPGIKWGFWL